MSQSLRCRLVMIGVGLSLGWLTPSSAVARAAVDPPAATSEAIAQLSAAGELFPAFAADLRAITDHLERSRSDASGAPLLVDSCHVRPHPAGLETFIEAREAVVAMGALLARKPPLFLARTVETVRASLVEAYRFLADAAIQEAKALGSGPSSATQTRNAEQQLGNALLDLARGDFGKGMQALRQAWQHAQLALPAPAGEGERPILSIQTPADGAILAAPPLTVGGMVQVLTAGTVGPEDVAVVVNGAAATVANRSFQATGIALRKGLNAVVAVARGNRGRSATACLAVRLDSAPRSRIAAVSGDGQTAPIGAPLPQPLVVKVIDTAGRGVAGARVAFRVVEGNGSLDDGTRGKLATTDGGGLARTGFVLGSRAGAGAHRVRATAVDFAGEAVFAATATTASPDSINVVTGDNQAGGVGAALAFPLVVVVTDGGQNPLPGVAVTFAVKAGGGAVAGAASTVIVTDENGRAAVGWTLGPAPGLDNNLLDATFAGLAKEPVTFKASGFVLGDPAATRVGGVVLDNQGDPVPGVTLRVHGTPLAVVTDAEGQFLLAGVPVGHVHLEADARTATRPGVWASLAAGLETLPGVLNTLPRPIYVPAIDVAGGRIAGGDEDVTISVPEIPGFALTVLAGSATFPDGARTGLVSVTPVHADKIPMPPGSGTQPRFVITIQPSGTRFDPPAPITFPNFDGLPAGSVTEMFSFDHHLGEFVSVGTGTVSEDGRVVRSDPGFGIVEAGWHSAAPQSGSGASATLGVSISTPEPLVLCAGGPAPVQQPIIANGAPLRDVAYSWSIADAGVAALDRSGGGLCPNAAQCNTTVTAAQGGSTTATVTITSATTGQSAADTLQIVAPRIEVLSLQSGESLIKATSGELVLGKDLTVNYQITAAGPAALGRAELRVSNRAGTVVYRQDVPAGPGPQKAIWPQGRWNQSPHSGAFANPLNGDYKVAIVGIKGGTECVQDDNTVKVRLVLEADLKDEVPAGARATEPAGLDDLLDALKLVLRNGANETVFSGTGSIAVTGATRFEKHVKVDAAGLNSLSDGDYEVLFQDLRDEIGNFTDADNQAANGTQPVKFTLSLR